MDVVKLEKALLDLTPGGSEYHGSPQRCLDWIKDRISMTGKLATERNQYRTAGDKLAIAVDAIIRGTGDDWHPALRESLLIALHRWREVTK